MVNAEKTRVFVWNMATYLRDAVNASAEEVPPGINGFERAGLVRTEGLRVPRSSRCRIAVQFECQYLQTAPYASRPISN